MIKAAAGILHTADEEIRDSRDYRHEEVSDSADDGLESGEMNQLARNHSKRRAMHHDSIADSADDPREDCVPSVCQCPTNLSRRNE